MHVSVVVPTCRRPQLLDRCLAALVLQVNDPGDVEFVIADDAGCESTRRQVEGWAAQSTIPIVYATPATAHGPAAARNAGWRAARGTVVAFTDDDCVPDPLWLREGLAAFRPGVAAVSGRTIVPLPEEPTDYERDAAGLATSEFVTANCFVKRAVLEEVGGFDERYTAAWREDSDLHFALLERGAQVVRAPAAVVVHPIRPAPWCISLRQQRKSMFNALLFKKFPRRYRQHIRADPPWGYYAIVGALAASLAGTLTGLRELIPIALVLWLILTARFCARRLQGTAHSFRHASEMVVTSVLIPPLSVFWRLYGALRFRVFFL